MISLLDRAIAARDKLLHPRSLDQFKASLITDGTISINRYDVTFLDLISLSVAPTAEEIKSGIFQKFDFSSKILTYRCESLNIPGVQLGTTDYKLYGGMPSLKIPNTRTFDEVQMTFLATRFMKDKYIFEEWIDKISDFTNNNISYYNDCSSDIRIDVYNERNKQETAVGSEIVFESTDDNGNQVRIGGPETIRGTTEIVELIPVYSLRLINSIPTRVETVQVGWGEVDQLFKYSVNFSYEALEYVKDSNVTGRQFNHLDKSFK